MHHLACIPAGTFGEGCGHIINGRQSVFGSPGPLEGTSIWSFLSIRRNSLAPQAASSQNGRIHGICPKKTLEFAQTPRFGVFHPAAPDQKYFRDLLHSGLTTRKRHATRSPNQTSPSIAARAHKERARLRRTGMNAPTPPQRISRRRPFGHATTLR